MGRLRYGGKPVEAISTRVLRQLQRDIRWAREAVAEEYGQRVASSAYDEDLAELAAAFAARPDATDYPRLSLAGANPFRGAIRI